MHHHYKTHNTCSVAIDFDIEDGVLHNVLFSGGCNGTLKAIGKLVEGKDPASVAALLRGNTCGRSSTSCADQLAKAIDLAQKEESFSNLGSIPQSCGHSVNTGADAPVLLHLYVTFFAEGGAKTCEKCINMHCFSL